MCRLTRHWVEFPAILFLMDLTTSVKKARTYLELVSWETIPMS
jgi:hypothetical protein